jgi:hypothetical protein
MMAKTLVVSAVVAIGIGCAPTIIAITGEEMCQAMHWPMPLPPTIGYSLNHLSNDSDLI